MSPYAFSLGNNMENDFLVTIIIPVWNREHTISYCLDSILSQLHYKSRLEIIIVDDSSTDATLSIINKITSLVTYPDIVNNDFSQLLPVLYDNHTNKDLNIPPSFNVICHERHLGAAAARNTGLANAKGRYIWFVDSDDIIATGSLKILEDILNNFNIDILRFQKQNINSIPKDYRLNYLQQNNIIMKDVNNIQDLLFMLSSGSVWNAIFERNFISSFSFNPDFHYSEDSLFSWQTTLKAKTAAYLPAPLYGYVLNPNSLTSVKPFERFACYVKVVECYLDAINESLRSLKDKKLLCEECEKRLYTHVFYTYELSEITKDMWRIWYNVYYDVMILNRLRPLYKRVVSFLLWTLHSKKIILLIYKLKYQC